MFKDALMIQQVLDEKQDFDHESDPLMSSSFHTIPLLCVLLELWFISDQFP